MISYIVHKYRIYTYYVQSISQATCWIDLAGGGQVKQRQNRCQNVLTFRVITRGGYYRALSFPLPCKSTLGMVAWFEFTLFLKVKCKLPNTNYKNWGRVDNRISFNLISCVRSSQFQIRIIDSLFCTCLAIT